LWEKIRNGDSSISIIDVREARDFRQGHIPNARLLPLPSILAEPAEIPQDGQVVFVCRSGRRSARAAYVLQKKGFANISVLQGGILGWEAAGLLEAVEDFTSES